MNIAWSMVAIDDLPHLRSYISESDPSAAQRVTLYILHQVEAVLPDNPEIGRPGRVAGTRELVIPRTPFIPYRDERAVARNLAHLSRRTTLAGSFLKRSSTANSRNRQNPLVAMHPGQIPLHGSAGRRKKVVAYPVDSSSPRYSMSISDIARVCMH
jgi:toxin ParE1/3/4